MKPKHKIGQVVKVYEYYSDMIVRNAYYGLIVDVASFRFEGGCHFIYHVLPNEDNNLVRTSGIQTAEEFAIEALEI
jgi:hypothetical protein